MTKYIIFAGTTEGKTISDVFEHAGIAHIVCVATHVGREVMAEGKHRRIISRRLKACEMEDLFVKEQVQVVLDATHPYACEVTKNIREASEKCGCDYQRIVRESKLHDEADEDLVYFETVQECAKAMKQVEGKILLTTGSKDLHIFAEDEAVRSRLIARVLPAEESLQLCENAGLSGRQIIAMFGPFSYEMNHAMLQQYDIACLVTKDSGRNGGFEEKVMAAKECGCKVFVIGRPMKETGISVGEAIRTYAGDVTIPFHISLCGLGPGDVKMMTCACKTALKNADLVLGAKRLLDDAAGCTEAMMMPYYLAKDIIPYLESYLGHHPGANIVILLSGDSGFYSGCTKLYEELTKWNCRGMNLELLPGISSVSYFAAQIAKPYSCAQLESWHGKADDPDYPGHLAAVIARHADTYVLLSAGEDVARLGALLNGYGLGDCEVTVGSRLSYPDQSVETCLAKNLEISPNGLCLAYVHNPSPKQNLSICLADDAFIRDKVPMTKADIRHLCVARLELQEHSVVYDIGAGTGSVAIEIAKQHESIRVFAVEQKPEAVELIQKNAALLHAENVTIVEAQAPDRLENLPVPTHAFIGGNAGRLREIIDLLLKRNPDIRIVITAVTIETVSEMTEVLKLYKDKEAELIQVSVSKNMQAGQYTLMQAQNPIYIAILGPGRQEESK